MIRGCASECQHPVTIRSLPGRPAARGPRLKPRQGNGSGSQLAAEPCCRVRLQSQAAESGCRVRLQSQAGSKDCAKGSVNRASVDDAVFYCEFGQTHVITQIQLLKNTITVAVNRFWA